MADTGIDNPPKRGAADRRARDRRKGQVPLEAADRRVAQRRSGEDRRAKARTRLTP